ncbi:hypothetical protein SAMN05216312_109216 [Cohnella sp. OV330]|uniref:hypothetical protein n=1 Tax=Cohnella sp. OV330 TaxID=1855288 RepID=UPI0008E48EED|nr:hypothetical protein [Cohnella sp. OV330]SFB47954.1 hypothetical protein SAMN05216312_109216 [Cohnella sp. OV330]
MKNVLIYPCGTAEGLELNRALGQMIHYRLYGLGDREGDPGELAYLRYEGFLAVEDAKALEKLEEIVDRLSIDYIYPADPEAQRLLMANKSKLRATVVGSPHDTLVLCGDKRKVDALSVQLAASLDQTPVDPGSKKVEAEYEVLAFTDLQGRLRFSRALRSEDSSILECDGESPVGRQLSDLAEALNRQLAFEGAWSFRVSHPVSANARITGIESGYSARFAYYRNKGINIATLSLFDRMGHQIEFREQQPGLRAMEYTQLRYRLEYEYDHVYIDLDDTLIVNGAVNPMLAAFIYQCRNKGKSVHLITKHRDVLHDTLERYRLLALFDQIVWLKSLDQKCLHMKNKRAIFIDDSFSERKQVSERLGIPVFEVSAVECLLDWRQ